MHFGKAAAALHVTQPALSRQIQQLEHDLGVTLFRRSGREVALTPAGEQFLQDSRDCWPSPAPRRTASGGSRRARACSRSASCSAPTSPRRCTRSPRGSRRCGSNWSGCGGGASPPTSSTAPPTSASYACPSTRSGCGGRRGHGRAARPRRRTSAAPRGRVAGVVRRPERRPPPRRHPVAARPGRARHGGDPGVRPGRQRRRDGAGVGRCGLPAPRHRLRPARGRTARHGRPRLAPLVETFVDATRTTAPGVTRPTPGSAPAP
ncbi:LysR family transcriptional regulator [Streptomyces cellulosae]